MAMYNSQSSAGTFFKPDVRAQYKAVEGKINLYDVAKAEAILVDSISYFPIEHFSRFKTKEEGYMSDILVKGTTQFVLKDPSNFFAYVGKYEYDFQTQSLKTLDGQNANWFSSGNFETVSIWIMDDDRIVELTIWWIVQTDLTSKKKWDPEKVKLFKDWTFLTLSAEEETMTVGKKPRQKTIHKIKIEWTTDEVPENIVERWTEIHKMIMAQIKKGNNPTEVVDEDELSSEEAEDVFQADTTNDIEDKPF